MKNEKRILTAAFLLFLISLISPNTSFAAYFALEPLSATISPGQGLSITITIDTEGEEVALGQATLLFDPNILTFSQITEGDFFPVNVDNTSGAYAGRIWVGGGLNPTDTNLLSGKGSLATITFSGKNPGTTNLSLDCADLGNKTSINKGYPDFQELLDCQKSTTGSYEVLGPSPTPLPPGGTTPTPGGTTPTPSPFITLPPETGGNALGLIGGMDTFTFALMIAVLLGLSSIF